MADLTTSPGFPFVWSSDHRTLVTQFESGKEQRRVKWSDNKERFVIRKRLSAADAATLRTFYNGKDGQGVTFTWTNPVDSTDYTVRFNSDSLPVTYETSGVCEIEFEFIEVPS